MKTAKLVTGILCMVFTIFILFQSCAVGLYNTLDDNGDAGGGAGLIVSILMLAGGIVLVASRDAKTRGSSVASFILFTIAALFAFSNCKVYEDLMVWGAWCAALAILSLICLIRLDYKNK